MIYIPTDGVLLGALIFLIINFLFWLGFAIFTKPFFTWHHKWWKEHFPGDRKEMSLTNFDEGMNKNTKYFLPGWWIILSKITGIIFTLVLGFMIFWILGGYLLFVK